MRFNLFGRGTPRLGYNPLGSLEDSSVPSRPTDGYNPTGSPQPNDADDPTAVEGISYTRPESSMSIIRNILRAALPERFKTYDDIPVTEAMRRAGAEILRDRIVVGVVNEEDLAQEIYDAMQKARRGVIIVPSNNKINGL